MPTTKRLMTDETGQDIASAIEDLAIAVKPDATEIPMASDSNATVAESITNLQDGIAIIADGNTHASATSGQFIFVKNHDISAGFTGNAALATGLYTASAAIGTNADLTTANLTADPNGGFNALQGQIDTLNSNIATKAVVKKDTIASDSSVTVQITKPAFVVVGRASISATSTTAFIDSWNGVVYLSKYSGLVVSCSDDIVTITNNSGFYGNYIVLY